MNTEDKVFQVIRTHFGSPNMDISLCDSFIDDLGADSLDCIEILMAIEHFFDIEVDEKTLKESLTVEQVIELVDIKTQREKEK